VRLDETISVELVVRGRRCVAVGGCREVLFKVERLVKAGALVEVFADRGAVVAGLARLIDDGSVTLKPRRSLNVVGAAVVFVSPEEEPVGAELAARARETGTLVCTLDRPEASTFSNPASADVSGLRVTVASGGVSPALVKRLRQNLEAILGDPRLAAFVRALGDLRSRTPRGERAKAMGDRVEGFRLEGRLVFPPWADGA